MTPLVFVSGSVPGITPWCSGRHVWGAVLGRFIDESIHTLELPGTGATPVPDAGLAVDAMLAQMRTALARIGRAHVVGHDLGGLVALSLAITNPELVAGVTTVASVAAAPTGDSVENLTHTHPPEPRFSRASQVWALERIVHSAQSIDSRLVGECVTASQGKPHESACAWMTRHYADTFAPSLLAAKARLFEVCRTIGFPVPAQVVWGADDPLGTLEQGLWSYRILAANQGKVQFHALNRAGSLVFRDAPKAFHQVVAAFHDDLA